MPVDQVVDHLQLEGNRVLVCKALQFFAGRLHRPGEQLFSLGEQLLEAAG